MMTTSDAPDTGARRTEGASGACPAPGKEVGQAAAAIVWRSVFDELPDENETVLICQEGDQDSIALGAVYAEGAVQEWANQHGEILDVPTHWAPLPEVPMEKGGGGVSADSQNAQQVLPTGFCLVRYNPRRRARGAEAAEVEVTWSDGETETLWMSTKNIRDNMHLYGRHPELLRALEAYTKNVALPQEVAP